jgi:ankyrin repeat protein
VIKVLYEGGLDLEYPEDETLLMYACRKSSRTEIIECLIELGSQVNSVNKFNETPLHFVCKSNRKSHEERNLENIKLLLRKGADPNMKDKYQDSPIIFAFRQGFSSVVKLLLEEGAELEVDKYGKVPPMVRCNFRKDMIVKLEKVIFDWHMSRKKLRNIKGARK